MAIGMLTPVSSVCAALFLAHMASGVWTAGAELSNTGQMHQEDTGCYVIGTMSVVVNYFKHKPSFNKTPTYSDSLLLPDSAPGTGNCSSHRTAIWIKSSRGIFTLGMVFESQTNMTQDTWALTELALYRNDRPGLDSPQLTKRGSLKKDGMLMFETPYNGSYQCRTKQRVTFQSANAHAALVFSQVRLQPFSESRSKLKTQNGVVCPEDLHSVSQPMPKAELVAPLVLTICLSLVLLLLVMGYMVHRRVESMGYINME